MAENNKKEEKHRTSTPAGSTGTKLSADDIERALERGPYREGGNTARLERQPDGKLHLRM